MLPHAQLVLKDECARLVRSWTGEPSSAAAEPAMPDPSFVMRPGRCACPASTALSPAAECSPCVRCRLGLGAKPAQLRGQAALSPADLQLQRALKKRGGGDKPDAIGAAGRAVAKPSSAAARSDEVDDEDEDEGRTSRFRRARHAPCPCARTLR